MKHVDSKEIKDIAIELGADMVGVASGDCVKITHRRRGPRNVLSEARSVIVFAKRMLRGSIESLRNEVTTCQNLTLYQKLDRISYELGSILEERGLGELSLTPLLNLTNH